MKCKWLTQEKSALAGRRKPLRKRAAVGWLLLVLCTGGVVMLAVLPCWAQETNSVPEQPGVGQADTNVQQHLQAIAALEMHLRSSQLAIEQTGKEARELAAQNAAMLSNGLQSIRTVLDAQQENLSTWRAHEVELLQSSNRATLVTVGAFATVAALAVLMIAYFQWRMSKAWSGIARGFSHQGVNGVVTALPAESDSRVLSGGAADSSKRLLGAVEQLERRIINLEQLSGAVLKPVGLVSGPEDNGHSSGTTGFRGSEAAALDEHGRAAGLLRQGKCLLKEGHLEAAIARFDEVLAITPKHGEALLKKGTALEKLQRLNEALECYDQAVAARESTSLAYLHKGGIYNRLERFKEALECYEKALHAHEERHG